MAITHRDRVPLRAQAPMHPNAKSTAAPHDGAPGVEESALTKMNNQHNKLGDAMPVRTHIGRRAIP